MWAAGPPKPKRPNFKKTLATSRNDPGRLPEAVTCWLPWHPVNVGLSDFVHPPCAPYPDGHRKWRTGGHPSVHVANRLG